MIQKSGIFLGRIEEEVPHRGYLVSFVGSEYESEESLASLLGEEENTLFYFAPGKNARQYKIGEILKFRGAIASYLFEIKE